MLPNSEKAICLPSGDQVGSTAPQVIDSESAAEMVICLSRTINRTAAMAKSENVTIRAGFGMPRL